MAVYYLWKKEVRTYFASPLAYILSALFIFLIGIIYFNLLVSYVENIQKLPSHLGGGITFSEAVLRRLFGNMNFILIFIAPLLSMRLLSEEKKQLTIELLYTAPISSLDIILGKYLASFTVVLFMTLPTILFTLILSSSTSIDFGLIGSSYLGIYFNVLCFLSLGIFASSLTENQIISAVTTIIFIMFFWLIAWFSNSTSNYLLAELLRYFSMIDHFDSFTRGVITFSDIFYHLSFIVLFLYITKCSLDSRNW